jgi:hypothetical protein
VAVEAALLRAARPDLDAHAAGALLVETAARSGTPSARAAVKASVVALPHTVRPGRVLVLQNIGPARVMLQMPAGIGASKELALGPGERRGVRVAPGAATRGGAVTIKGGPVPLRVRIAIPAPPPPARIGALELVRRKGRVTGVRFAAGRVERRPGGVSVEPVGSLVLRLAGPAARELTPPGGSRDLLPAVYAYTLTGEVLGGLPAGRYRFVVRARGPAGGRPLTRSSPTFSLR